jgi:hypothetical protein
MKCSICQNDIQAVGDWMQGHNAQPVSDGRCCANCNLNVVVLARLTQMAEEIKQPPAAVAEKHTCSWCRFEDKDVDLHALGSEFLCDDCCKIASAGSELLAALGWAVMALNLVPRFQVAYRDSYLIAAECDWAISLAKGEGKVQE